MGDRKKVERATKQSENKKSKSLKGCGKKGKRGNQKLQSLVKFDGIIRDTERVGGCGVGQEAGKTGGCDRGKWGSSREVFWGV